MSKPNSMPPIVAMMARKYTLYTLGKEGRPMVRDWELSKEAVGIESEVTFVREVVEQQGMPQ
jgi:hypothetical protein